jgi:hypothetical protein
MVTDGTAVPAATGEHTETHQQFTAAMVEAQMSMHKGILDAHRQYAESLQQAQRDLEQLAADAYQRLLAAHVGSSAASSSAAAAQQEYVRVISSLAGQTDFADEVVSAHRELVAALREAESAPDAVQRVSAAYRKYWERLESSWKAAQEKYERAGKAYMAMISAYGDDLLRQQQDFKSAFETYVKQLEDAFAHSDFANRATTAAKSYKTALDEAWSHGRSLYMDAAAALLESQKKLVESIRSDAA